MHSLATPRRALILAAAVLLLGVTVAVVDDHRTTQAAAEQAAQHEFGQEVDQRRRAMSAAAQDAREGTRSLRLGLAATAQGTEADLEGLEERRAGSLERVRAAADELESVDARPRTAGHELLPASDTEPVLQRLADLEAQAGDLAERLRHRADEAERWAEAATGLTEQARDFASRDLPSTDDPGQLAARWRSDAEELAGYREAAEQAAREPGLEPVAAAHLQLVDGLAELSDEAATLLEDGEVDRYNELLTERLGDDDPFGFAAALDDALDETATTGPVADLEDDRQLALQLLTGLDELRGSDPLRSAAG